MKDETIYDATSDEAMEGRSKTEIIRGSEDGLKVGESVYGKIKSYKFSILVRDKPTLEGELSREQMNLIHSLYSREGANLSQREVARNFANYTFEDFKKILRAFNITKASIPLAPHMLEEKNSDELIELTLNNRENNYLRRLEQDRNRVTESHLKEMTKRYYELKETLEDFSGFFSNIKFNVVPVAQIKPKNTNSKTLVVYISDMHIGAEVSGYSVYENTFDKGVAEDRLMQAFTKIVEVADNFNITNIVICNVGDSLDGYDGYTTRGGHKLPQNMNNKDQYKNYLEIMIQFFSNLSTCGRFSNIEYMCVEGGNHDGDAGFMANKSLEACLTILNPEIVTEVFEKFMDYFQVGSHIFVLCHGKDAKDMFKNMPLVLNDKWENQINEYLDYNDISPTSHNIHFVKGDLHQTATTYGKKFRYKSVASFFGSSGWIHKNFGNTKAAVDYDIINGEDIFEGRLLLN